MALSAGTKLGPYEIVGALGAGGMGVPPLHGGSSKSKVRSLNEQSGNVCR